MTYIPKQTKLTKERVEAKLETSLVQKLERYCEYLESDRDYVIGEALDIAFRKDKGFAEWLVSREMGKAIEAIGDEAKPTGRKATPSGAVSSRPPAVTE